MTLTEAFAELPDPCTGPAQRHDLAEWAEDNEACLKRYLVLEHGTPSHDTFGSANA